MLFSCVKRICTIVGNQNVKIKHFKELRKETSLDQKYPTLFIEASILKPKEIPL